MVPGNRKFLPLNDSLVDYVEVSRTGSDDPILKSLRDETARFGEDAQMQLPDSQGTLMTILTRLVSAKSALEIGTFTGHSSICIARGLGEGGKLICLDSSKEWTNVAKEFWDRAGVSDKIELQLGDALERIAQFSPDQQFDLVHIDAEKLLYNEFFEAVLPRVVSNGLIVFDNMLRAGRVVEAETDDRTLAIKRLNSKLASDPRVETVLVTVGDGIQLCRKR